MSEDLEPIDPETAVEMYLDDRRHNVAEATLQAHHYRLKQFTEWCQAQGIKNLNNLTGRDLHKFRVKRRNEDELATATMKGQLATLRMLLRFAATIDAVEPQLDEKIILPKTTEEDARDEMLETDQAKQMLEHLEQYEYATLEHALIETLWHTGIRIGAARSLDAEDYKSEERYLVLEHDSEQDTPLKNGKQGERFVAVNDRVCRVLEDWLDVNHPGGTDEYGRTPLFATNQGRLSRNHGRSIAYQCTRPCTYTNHCPHDRDIDTCEGLNNSRAYECPSSLSPHPIRRGSITHHLQADTPEEIVSSRMDVSSDVLSRHYDQRSEIEKMRQRRQYLPGE
jgi:site-specific recombinase XerD